MIECLSAAQLAQFIATTGLEWVFTQKEPWGIIVQATEGDVTWFWQEGKDLYCRIKV